MGRRNDLLKNMYVNLAGIAAEQGEEKIKEAEEKEKIIADSNLRLKIHAFIFENILSKSKDDEEILAELNEKYSESYFSKFFKTWIVDDKEKCIKLLPEINEIIKKNISLGKSNQEILDILSCNPKYSRTYFALFFKELVEKCRIEIIAGSKKQGDNCEER